MKLGISTDFEGEFELVDDIEKSLRQIAEAGFSHMHWCFEWDGDYQYAASEMEQIRGWMDKYGLEAKSLHASKGSRWHGDGGKLLPLRKDYRSPIEANRLAGVELVKNRVELAHVLGATEIVLHMYLPFYDFEKGADVKEAYYERVFRSMDELQPFCMERNVRICVENMYEAPGDLQIEQFDRLFARYPKEFLGLCLDTGHAHLVWGNEFIEKFAARFADRIYSVHLHDNNGWGKEPGCNDAHILPGEGSIDWPALMAVLKKSAYEQPWVLEVMKPAAEKAADYLKRAHAAGEWMAAL